MSNESKVAINARLAMVAVAAALLALCAYPWMYDGDQPKHAPPIARNNTPSVEPAPPRPEANLVRALTPEQALEANANTPLSHDPLQSAPPFKLAAVPAAPNSEMALDCLTAAVYYEAAGQGQAGERAIAQVVLNRVRHPAFPSSVCGVVYEGSDRRTGCQFTFTCDGSLDRKPTASGWLMARRVAADALNGKVDRDVGMATHYHASYVVPYWAASLSKIAVVGDHIFYNWPGYWGRRAAFTQSYSGDVPRSLPVMATSLDSPLSGDDQLVTTPGIVVPLSALKPSTLNGQALITPAAPPVLADERKGTLKLDERRPIDEVSPLK